MPHNCLTTANCPQAKKYDRAIAILAKHSWWDKLIGVVRALEKNDTRNLSTCAQHFRKVNLMAEACATLRPTLRTLPGMGFW